MFVISVKIQKAGKRKARLPAFFELDFLFSEIEINHLIV
jgi:hypothetical protein